MNQNISPNKLPRHLHNPIDIWILDICDKLDSFFVKCNMTPNKLTTISGYFGLLSVYCLYNKIKYLPGIFYFISYIFDGADGQYARRHNMVSKFGDYYDKIKDNVINLILFYILYKRRKFNIAIIIFGLACIPHMSCTDVYCYKKNPNESKSALDKIFNHICPYKDTEKLENFLSYTRYFGLGTTHTVISIILFFA